MPGGVVDLSTLRQMMDRLGSIPSPTGHPAALGDAAKVVQLLAEYGGLRTEVVATPEAPVVLGWFDAGVSTTTLVYANYDTYGEQAPNGIDGAQRPAWETGEIITSAGCITKAELVARLAALRYLIDAKKLRSNIFMVIEGDALCGSRSLNTFHDRVHHPDFVLWNGGSSDHSGVPILYGGAKGLLQVTITATAANIPLPLRYAASLPNPVWNLLWALDRLKSRWEEILPEGFYDTVQPPDRSAMAEVIGINVGEDARRENWGVEQFVAGLKGTMLLRAELFSPTCNISRFEVDGTPASIIPTTARATVQLQLVPDQQPDEVWEQIQAQFMQWSPAGVKIERLPGSFRATPRILQQNWYMLARTASLQLYGTAHPVLSMAPFSAPVELLVSGVPMIAAGLERAESRIGGQNERVSVNDLRRHADFIAEILSIG
ncbi:MAG: M20/M25/M40 family metallo-hydrolase [Herpetosiphon sp.]